MPPPTTLAQLLTTSTQATVLANLLGYLTARGFPVTNWNPGSVGDTLTQSWSQAVADLSGTLVNLAASGFLGTAAAGWLDLLGLGAYQAVRNPALQALGTFQLACAGGQGPYNLGVGQLWAADAAGHRYTNATGGLLTSGATLNLSFAAESPGAGYSIGLATALALQTPLPGVTVAPFNLGGNTWMTQVGADAEGDTAFALRCQLKWGALAGLGGQGGATTPALTFWALQSNATVKRVLVLNQNPYGPGTTGVIVAPASGAFSGDGDPAVVACNATIQAIVPITAAVQVHAAAALAIAVSGTVYYQQSLLTAAQAQAQVEANLDALFSAVPINGTVYYSRIVEAIQLPQGGVQNIRNAAFVLANGAALDIALGPTPTYQVPTRVSTLTYVPVA